jgi:dTDP-4-dehydrorhamnose 3,5-epimerase|tara:strand:- start:292 stop:822 length:531 start_codon:yes stop_codon:yes gene_type:complete
MKKLIFKKTKIKGLYLIKPKIFKDDRGEFFRYFCSDEYKNIFFKNRILQTNICINKKKGILRGLHYQKKPYEETKIVTCISGEVYDVAVDLRKNSKTFMNYFGTKLSEKNKDILLIPKGFAHGYITLKKNSTVLYLVDSKYNPKLENGIKYDDKRLKIKWPLKPKYISQKDKELDS